MASVSYTAQRSLASGHTINNVYTIDFDCMVLDIGDDEISSEHQALNGDVTKVLWSIVDTWAMVTDFITAANLPYWQEFLNSVRAGESFTFDAYGTSAVPDNPQTCKLKGKPEIKRVSTKLEYTANFSVMVVP